MHCRPTLGRRNLEFFDCIPSTGWWRNLRHGEQDVAFDRAVASVFTVVSKPIFQLFSGVSKAQELVGVQKFCAAFAVDGVDRAIIGRIT